MPNTFGKFNKYTGSNEPANNRNELPEYPMLWAFGYILHHPGIIKGNIGFPCRHSHFVKSFANPNEGRKTSNVPIKINNE